MAQVRDGVCRLGWPSGNLRRCRSLSAQQGKSSTSDPVAAFDGFSSQKMLLQSGTSFPCGMPCIFHLRIEREEALAEARPHSRKCETDPYKTLHAHLQSETQGAALT